MPIFKEPKCKNPSRRRTTDSSDIDAVDIFYEAPINCDEEHIMTLFRASNLKLRVVNLQDSSMEEDVFRDLCDHGLTCEVLNLRSTRIQRLNISGKFMQLHTLNLDFSTSITSFHRDCFSCMPNLKRLSMCGTRVVDLWTTVAALSKLPSLSELRFQNCLCCKDTSSCPRQASPIDGSYVKLDSPANSFMISGVYANEVTISGFVQEQPKLRNQIKDEEEFNLAKDCTDESMKSTTQLTNYNSHHPCPICYEKHYREFIITSLPALQVLDNSQVTKFDKETAKVVISKHYEHLPYNRHYTENVSNILRKREIGASKSRFFLSRSLSAAKFGSAGWPLLSNLSHMTKDETFRPRQFEYHPSDSSLMVFGTMDGEVVVINHENGKIVGSVPSSGAMNSILGLCWLNMYPSKLLAGSDNGCLRLFDINQMPPKIPGVNYTKFHDFEPLTSVHINCTDDQFLASGYSKDVAFYDINTTKRIQLFKNMHEEPINVAKFAYHSPFLFATSSFDRDVKLWDLRQRPNNPCYRASSCGGNVMVCFSPDDQYLLVSAVDNEVKQLSAVDGRLHTNFEISPTGSAHNYTRSYYINGGDYIISGSSDQHVVHIYSAITGRRLKDVYLQNSDSGNSQFVQSLRGDPFRAFHMSVLAASKRPTSKYEIIKVNLLSTSQSVDEFSHDPHMIRSSSSLGG
ncbi:protein DWD HYPERSENSITIVE TO UV-B 1 [Mercurialis annua]|uniref:protein DWD HYPERSENSITIVE TO UV-B 1 n=1 Tax=Mercurialis annua TaxID=3986 RepID=UPI00215EA3FD|nr:protein DWD HYPERSENSITIVE TO UV-B 1 [Mercurialis annua]